MILIKTTVVLLLVIIVCSAPATCGQDTETDTVEQSTKDCGIPSSTSVVNGTWNTNGPTTVNFTATLNCNPGYEPSNTSLTNITCQNDGNWSSLTATCETMTSSMPDVAFKIATNGIHETNLSTYFGNGCGNKRANYTYTIFLKNNTHYGGNPYVINCSSDSDNKTYTFTKLMAGTYYTFDLTLKVNGLQSDTNRTLSQYTRPQTPDFIKLFFGTMSSMNVTWGFNTRPVGRIDSFHLSVSPDSRSPFIIENTNTTSYSIQKLSGGMFYTVSVYSMIENLSSEAAQTVMECTHPAPPKDGYVSSQENHTILIAYNATEEKIEQYNIFYNGTNFTTNSSQNEAAVLNISGLQEGTNYTFNVTSLACNKQSLTSQKITTFTRPGDPHNARMSGQTQTSINASWSAPCCGMDNFSIWLTTQGKEGVLCQMTVNTTFHEFRELTAGTNYTVHVQTVWRGLTSAVTNSSSNTAPANFTVNTTCITETTLNFTVIPVSDHYTYRFTLTDTRTNVSNMSQGPAVQFTDLVAGHLYSLTVTATLGGVNSIYPTVVMVNTPPTIPEDVNLEIKNGDVHNTSITLTLNVCPNTTHIYSAHMSPSDNHSPHFFDCSTEASFDYQVSKTSFEGLSPGSPYTFILVLSVDGVTSHTNRTKMQYTKPHTLDFVNLSSITETTMNITWGFNSKQVGQYDEFSISVSPDIGSSIPTLSNTTTSCSLSNLTGGTVYSVNVSSLIGNLSSETPQTVTGCTYPAPPQNGYVSSQENHTIQIAYYATKENIELYRIIYNGSNFTTKSSQNEAAFLNISGLQEGTNYTFNVISWACNKQSLTSQVISTFTRPGDPRNARISGQTQTSINASWIVPCCGVDYFSIWLTTRGSKGVSHRTNTTSYEFKGLIAGMNYTVHVQTVWRGLTSAVAKTSSNTAPANFTVNTTCITETTLNFTVIPVLDHQTYRFTLTDTRTNESNMSQGPSVQFTELAPGRLYRLTVTAALGGVDSIYPTILTINTRPGRVGNINLVEERTTNTSMAISWGMPNGDFDNVTVNVTCTGPNGGSRNCLQYHNSNTNTTNCSGLDPGTFCRVEIQTKSGIQTGDIVYHNISKSTREEAPSTVGNITYTQSSRYISINWNRPRIRNGIIRKYRVVLEDDSGECNNTYIVSEFKCNTCLAENASVDGACQAKRVENLDTERSNTSTGQVFTDTMNASFPDLVPGRNYTITVIAYTKCWGPATVMYVRTDEEEPKGPPMHVNSSSTIDSVTLIWNAPRCEDITGVITNYIVEVNFYNTTCYPNKTAINNTFTTILLTFVLNETQAFNDYNFTIRAATAIGTGPPSSPITEKTKAMAPSHVRSLANTTVTSTSVVLTWKAPCFQNGVFSNFTVGIINRDTNEQRYESSTLCNINITELKPYRNYTFFVSQYNTEGMSGIPQNISITTQPGVPHTVRLLYNSSNSFSVTVGWSPPDMYTGVTRYTVRCVDSHFNKETYKSVWGFNSTELTVDGLRAYWNYSISVIARTTAGTNESGVTDVQTLEAKPGPIANLTLFPETNVTKPRTVTVVWQEPKLEDKNGIIIGYVVYYRDNTVNVSASIHKTVLPNLSTGIINVKVAAKTSAGVGNVTTKATEVLPGAPLKLNESSQPLILQSNQGITDSETQLSIMLPLRSFFCNDTNGKTTRWGLVVAQTSRITGNKPYIGDVAGFNKILLSYRKWKDIEKADIIDPYIPTSSDWNPCNQTDTRYRMKRSVSSKITDTTFLIGEDKECNVLDSMGYCNGQLAPGRQYSVRGFVCTSGGCTESEYSRPIWTDPDPTIPIVAGVVSVVVIILVGVVLIVFMKRRQTACFATKVQRAAAVKVEETEATEMTETVTKVHAFKPCSVPLSEFSAHVTDMHKDSNLRFADAFVLVKENSPALSSSMAVTQACRPKNRYTNILSFDHSRVKLLPLEDVEGSDFINANYIPGYKSKRAYIATQGPLPSTFDDFWRMIWEQNVGIIVMLTKLVEKGRNKCDMYWPKLNEPVFFGDIVACTTSESTLPDYTLRVIELKLKDQVRIVRQFSFLKWPDMGCPDHPGLLLDFVKAVRNPEFAGRGPMVVHCSAGVGRTGTFIAVDSLLQYVQEYDTVDIYNLVLEMRHNRCNMVQTEDQFIYIYECLKEFINMNIRNEESEDEEPVYEDYGENVYENIGFSDS